MSLSRAIVCVLGFLLITGAASATTWNVAQTVCNNTTCAPCCDIQAAVGHAVGNDVISVAPGTYVEQVDFRGMLTVGDITLEAASGPGTVLITYAADEPLRHSDTYTNTVTLDGIDVTSGGGYSCVFFNHSGNVVMRDVTANVCGYTALMLDNPGTVELERCTANGSGRTGIQVDGAASAQLTDCTANSNASHGIHIINVSGTVDMINPTAVGNADEGVGFENGGANTITGATLTDNGRSGIRALISGSITVVDSTITGSFDQGLDLDWDGADPVDSVTLTGTQISNNGHGGNEDGTRLRNVDGPVVLTNCVLDNNGQDGIFCDSDVVGDIEISGGRANGNGDDGYDLRVVGNATVIGTRANNNGDNGIVVGMPGTIFFQNCIANDNIDGSGFDLQWQDPDPLDGASVIDCTAHDNGLAGGGNGIRVKHVAGSVTVVGARANGNFWTGVRVDDTAGSVLIRDVIASFGLEDGIKVDADIGPVTIFDSIAEGNVTEGLIVRRETLDVESLYVRRNAFVANGGTGMALSDLVGSGLMSVQCNDVAGNNFGLYLDAPVALDASKVWWGHVSGPSSQGPGTGDGIFAEPGGTITYNPWLMQSITSPLTDCEMFGSGLESGLFEEWDVVVN